MKIEKNKVVIGLLIILILITIILHNIFAEITIHNQMKEQQRVNEYIECLENNNMQRDYCARKQESSYYYMDKLTEKYGYTYEINNKDIKIVKVGK